MSRCRTSRVKHLDVILELAMLVMGPNLTVPQIVEPLGAWPRHLPAEPVGCAGVAGQNFVAGIVGPVLLMPTAGEICRRVPDD
jgi:hypothetical protein